MGLYLLALLCSNDGFKAFFNRPQLRWLGKVSYSVYLVHYPILWFFALVLAGTPEISAPVTWAILGGVAIPLVLAVSHFTYHYIEPPIMDHRFPSPMLEDKEWVFIGRGLRKLHRSGD